VELPIEAPLRIAHLSDLHLSGFSGRQRRVVEILERESPDLIAITGDVLSEGASFDQVKIALTAFHAPLGVWLVGSGEYISGWYQKRASRMYVSRGIGMTILPFRLLCRPEVALVTLNPARP